MQDKPIYEVAQLVAYKVELPKSKLNGKGLIIQGTGIIERVFSSAGNYLYTITLRESLNSKTITVLESEILSKI